MSPSRDYDALRDAIGRARGESPVPLSHRRFVDLLWEHLAETEVSWLGIYLVDESAPAEQRLVLGCCRDRPACSPIGLHGVCGRGVLGGRAVVVRDVAELGDAYVACDPSDRSEVVVPLADGQGVWGVLDLDSRSIGAFDGGDAERLADLVQHANLARPTGSGDSTGS